MKSFGIEKIAFYPSSLFLDFQGLALHRGYDLSSLDTLMVKERSVNPVWEDSVTMAVNAVEQLQLSEQEKQEIGLLIVTTETGVDHEKSISSWVHHFCNLSSHCRNFEIKSACYAGTAALRMTLPYLKTQLRDSKALIVTTDQSMLGLGAPSEYVLGGGATALLVSDQPFVFEIPSDPSGFYAHEVTDIIRPLPWLEAGNNEVSLFSYIDSLENAYQAYVSSADPALSFDERFDFNVYHMPFAGISYRAHRILLNRDQRVASAEIRANFDRKVRPALAYPQRVGGTYSGCVFLALLSLVANAPDIAAGHLVGIFSYGSGSCAEYYTAIVGEHAKQVVEKATVDKLLDDRLALTIEEYELLERLRVDQIKGGNFVPNMDYPARCYDTHYRDKKKLVLRSIKDYYRQYAWS